jgi:hypothetical protein
MLSTNYTESKYLKKAARFVQSNICAQINRFHPQQMKRKIRRELHIQKKAL